MNTILNDLLFVLVGAIFVPTSVHVWLDARGLELIAKIRAKFGKPAAPK
jgi:hypothetical protein